MYKARRTAELLEQFDRNFDTYKGDITVFERAVGAYFCGRRLGWKLVYLIHDTKTIRKYEKLLGIDFRKEFDDFEDLGYRTRMYRAVKALSNFWKAVKGETDFEKSTLMGK